MRVRVVCAWRVIVIAGRAPGALLVSVAWRVDPNFADSSFVLESLSLYITSAHRSALAVSVSDGEWNGYSRSITESEGESMESQL